MSFLENKIPPPIVWALFAFIIWIITKYTTQLTLNKELRLVGVSIFLLCGLYFCTAGVVSFRKAKTTVNALKPETASSLVQSGIYNISRNPMYVGLALMMVAWSVYLGSLLGLLGVLGFVIYMNRFQIKPEEQALTSLFGEEFLEYKLRVRKWL